MHVVEIEVFQPGKDIPLGQAGQEIAVDDTSLEGERFQTGKYSCTVIGEEIPSGEALDVQTTDVGIPETETF